MAATLSFNLAGAFKGLSLSSSSSSSSSVRGDAAPIRVGIPSQLHIKPRSLTITCAHKMGGGSTKNGRDSPGQRLGVKIYGDQVAKPGSIIIRQRGTKFYPGNNVGIGKDHTIYSLLDGVVKFETFGPQHKQKVSVYPLVKQPENPDTYRAKKREFFRLRRERRKAKKEAWKNGALAPQLVLASAEEVPEGSPAC